MSEKSNKVYIKIEKLYTGKLNLCYRKITTKLKHFARNCILAFEIISFCQYVCIWKQKCVINIYPNKKN